MPGLMPEPYRCRHVHTEGRQCGSPALRGEKLCFHHHSARRPLVRRPGDSPATPHLPAPEDLPAIQRAIGEVLRLIATGHIEDKPAKMLLAGLALASANLARIDRQRRADLAQHLMVRRFLLRHPEEVPALGLATFPPVLVTDLVDDPELGSIAPGPDPTLRAEGPIPAPTPLLVPQPAGISPEQTAAIYARADRSAALERKERALARKQEHDSLATAAQQVYETMRLARIALAAEDKAAEDKAAEDKAAAAAEINSETANPHQTPEPQPVSPSTPNSPGMLDQSQKGENIALLVSPKYPTTENNPGAPSPTAASPLLGSDARYHLHQKAS